VIASRWTRTCFCGQATSEGTVDSHAWVGKAAGAGSEEGRTIFFEKGLANEGDRLPVDNGPQGDKITILPATGSVPQAVPFTVLRIGSGLIATVPGEPTVGVGRQIRAAVGSVLGGSGIRQVAIVGYAGDYLNYFTTPAEYEQQAYEGGFTVFGEASAGVLRDTLVGLTQDLVGNRPAPAPYVFDPSAGVHVTSANYSAGGAAGIATGQPGSAARLGHAAFSWRSGSAGANGLDRPVDRRFVSIQRRSGRRWVPVTDDLGLQIMWSSDGAGAYQAQWEVPLSATPGSYRFVVSAKRYLLASRRFSVSDGAILTPAASGRSVTLGYPQPYLLNAWTYRPTDAAGGTVRFLADGRRRIVRERSTDQFPIPAGGTVSIPAGGARDRYGNTNPQAVRVR
jgi:neutral ceramidase